MRKFEFRLERVLRLRGQLEEIQREETLVQENVVRGSEESLRELVFREGEVRNELTPSEGERWPGLNQQENYRYLTRLTREEAEEGRRLEKETERLKEEQEKLVERSRERRTLERLRERYEERWRLAMSKEEQSQLDEIAQSSRRRTKGSAVLTTLLLLAACATGALAFVLWNNWLTKGDVGFPILRAPFDASAQKRARTQVSMFELEERLRRNKRDARLSERAQDEVVSQVDVQGDRRTLDLIELKEENIRRRQEELRSSEAALERERRDYIADLNTLNDLRERIDREFQRLKELESRRTREMSEEHRRKLDSLSETLSQMTEKAAAKLLLAIAFPVEDPEGPVPLPLGEGLERSELVIDVLLSMAEKDRAKIMDKMTKEDPGQTAILADMMDDVRTGLEPDPVELTRGQ